MRSTSCIFRVLSALALLAAGSASPSPAAPGSPPSSTLLLPYFEVDLTSFQGPTTLFSVNNAGTEAVVAHVVVWTDWGLPTYSFDLALAPDDVQTINLRDLFLLAGSVPSTAGLGLEDCSSPVASPPLDRTALRRRHTGQADLGDGLCYGSGLQGPDIATGYVTVDVVKRCSGTVLWFPTHLDYFPNFAIGTPDPDTFLAAYDNVLWGDALYVAEEDASAQGVELVHIPSLDEGEPGKTFYRRYSGDGYDRRVPLSSHYRGRYLDGAGFDGGTDLLVWLESEFSAEPRGCEAPLRLDCHETGLRLYDEDAQGGGEVPLSIEALAFRLPIDTEAVTTPAPFGVFDLDNAYYSACYSLPTGPIPAQAWVTSVMSAEGRYSVGLSATPIPPREP